MQLPGWARGGRWGGHVFVLALYTFLALIFSFPLILHLGDAIAGVQGDVWSYVWAMGWAKSSIELGVNPFRNDYVFYPLGGATQLLWASALPSLASLPLQYAFGLIPAFNLTYLGATVLTAYGTYLLTRDVLGEIQNSEFRIQNLEFRSSNSLAAVLSGAAFAFCAMRLGYGLAFTNLYHTELIPFYILFLFRATREHSWRNVVWAGVLLGLNSYIDFQIAVFLALFSVLWVVWRFLSSLLARRAVPNSAERNPAFGSFILTRAAATAAIGLAVSAPMGTLVAQDLMAEGGNYIRVYPIQYSAARSSDVLSFLLPNARSRLYQALPAPHIAGINAAVNVEGESQLSPDRQSFLGLTVLALAVLGVWRRPRAALFWLAATIIFALLSLGPVLHIAGFRLAVPLPFALLHEVPLANHIRIPMRYGLMVMLGAAILAGIGARIFMLRVRPMLITVVLTLLVLAEAAVLPYPTLVWSVPEIYSRIASEPGDFTVLEIPTMNWRPTAATEVYQVIDDKRRLRVYTNRIAPDIADYFSQRQTPIVTRSLRVLEGAEDGTLAADEIAQDRAAASEVIDFFHLRYVVVHGDWLDADRVGQVDRYLQDVLGARSVYDDGTVRAYRLPSVPGTLRAQTIELASDASLMHLGRGWQTEPRADEDGEQGRFLRGSASEIYFRTNCDVRNAGCGPAALEMRAYSENAGVVLQLQIDGHTLDGIKLQGGWANYHVVLPPGLSPSGMSVIRFIHPDQADSIAIQSLEIH